MTSTTTIEQGAHGWLVNVHWGRFTQTHGPYRWRWTARVVAWLEDGQH